MKIVGRWSKLAYPIGRVRTGDGETISGQTAWRVKIGGWQKSRQRQWVVQPSRRLQHSSCRIQVVHLSRQMQVVRQQEAWQLVQW